MKTLDALSVYQGLLLRLVELSNVDPSRGVAVAITSVNHGEGVTYVTDSLATALQVMLEPKVHRVSLQALECVRDDPSEVYAMAEQTAVASDQMNRFGQQATSMMPGMWNRGFESRIKIMRHLCSRAPVVLVDCPPLRPGDNTLSAVPVVDVVILVVQAGATTKADILFAERKIVASGGTIEGYILNKVASSKRGWFNKRFGQRA